ncbi:MAG: hypothetical protein RLZZ595_1041 [Bacteroidota bacterium]|jgi:hypothetical protein
MKKTNMEWNNKIKEQLQEFEQSPPETTWETLAQKLNDQPAKIVPIRSDYAKASTWIKYAFEAAAVIIISLSLFSPSFRDSIKNAVNGPGIKAAVIDSPKVSSKDSISIIDSVK